MTMQKIKTEKVQIKLIFLMTIVAMAAVLIPLFRIAYYNFMSVDDFSYALHAGEIWEETHSVFKVLIGQIPYTWEYYFSWQGTFFSVWLTTSITGIFGENAYYVTTWFTLGGFVLSESFFLMTVMRKVLGADWIRAGIITMCCIIMQVLLTPAPCEGFFWLCGAMLYTFIHALALVLCTLWILLYQQKGRKKWKDILLCIGIVVLTIAISGSNYITALTLFLLYVFCTLYYYVKRHPKKIFVLVCNILYVMGFLVNVLAPGNGVRQAAANVVQVGAVKSILLSLKEAAVYITTWTIFPGIVMGILLIPLFVNIVRRKEFRYPFPALVSLLSFCVFAAQFTPTIYALGFIGEGRVRNLYRFNYFLLVYGNELYWIGWCYNRILKGKMISDNSGVHSESGSSWLLPGWLAGSVILMLGLSVWGGSTVTTVNAIKSLREGEAKQYYAEYLDRLQVLEEESIDNAELKPFTVKPYMLFFGDIEEDQFHWINESMADYYGKEKVILKRK